MITSRFLMFSLLVLLVSGVALVACSSGDGAYSSASDDDDDGAADGDGTGDDDDDGGEPTPAGTPEPPEPGQLTAGDFDDNLNFDWYGQFTEYFDTEFPAYPLYLAMDRVTITVTNAQGDPVPNADVVILDGATTLFRGPTGTDGRLLYFPERDGDGVPASALAVTPVGGAAHQFAIPSGAEWNLSVTGSAALPQALDLAFVVDATGSMMDEMEYLKDEIDGIADYVSTSYPSTSVRYGLVVYRDDGDEYVTRTFDFSDIQSFRANLEAQSANGGGDWPEAIDRAMQAAGEMSWRSGNVARVAFLIADAPAHDQYISAFYRETDVARELGIHYYPIAASGTMGDAEYLFRVLGQATGGRFLFLTDDSGIGFGHFDPHLPCFQVQHLNQLITRMIASELTGARQEANPADVLRTVGNYNEGVCSDSQPSQMRLSQAIRKHANVPQ